MENLDRRSGVISFVEAQKCIPSAGSDHTVTLLEGGTVKINFPFLCVRPCRRLIRRMSCTLLSAATECCSTTASAIHSRQVTCCLSPQERSTSSKTAAGIWLSGLCSTA